VAIDRSANPPRSGRRGVFKIEKKKDFVSWSQQTSNYFFVILFHGFACPLLVTISYGGGGVIGKDCEGIIVKVGRDVAAKNLREDGSGGKRTRPGGKGSGGVQEQGVEEDGQIVGSKR
jgi:hypothetical protein